MIRLKTIPTSSAELRQLQENVAAALALVPVAATPNIVTVNADYKADGTEDAIHVNAQTGPVKVTLPAPSSMARPLVVKQINLQNSKSTVNTVTVASADGSETIGGKSSIDLDDSGTGAVSFTSDKTQHWPDTGSGGNPPGPPPGGLVYTGIPPIYVNGTVISFSATPTPPGPPAPVVVPWVAPVTWQGPLLGDVSGAETWQSEVPVDFTNAPVAFTFYWWFQSLSSSGSAIFRIRIGNPGSAYRDIAGPILASFTETASTLTSRSIPVPMAGLTGVLRVVLTAQASAAGQKAQIQGANGQMR